MTARDAAPPDEQAAAHPPGTVGPRLGARQERLLRRAEDPWYRRRHPEASLERLAAPQELPGLSSLLPHAPPPRAAARGTRGRRVLVQPAPEQRPAGNQRLVGELDPVRAVHAR